MLGEPALQDGGELAGDGELQRFAALGVVDADGHGGHVDLRPGERDYLGETHSGVEAEAGEVADDRVARCGAGVLAAGRERPAATTGSDEARIWRKGSRLGGPVDRRPRELDTVMDPRIVSQC